MLLAGQTPIGEILAAPSATRLDAISACLLDCTDHARIARLRARGPEWLTQVGGDLQAYLNWGRLDAHARRRSELEARRDQG
jgi:hypothetical protein